LRAYCSPAIVQGSILPDTRSRPTILPDTHPNISILHANLLVCWRWTAIWSQSTAKPGGRSP
jgi:hypothetical protein